jgi:cystathionine beta-lyase
MSHYDFNRIIDRRGSGAMKWDDLPKKYGRLIPMSMADMDFPLPEEVLEAFHKRIDHGFFGYAAMVESDYQAVLNWIERMHGQVVPKEWLFPGHGVVPTMRAAQFVLTKPDDKIVVQGPVHTPFFSTASRFGREVVDVPLLKDETGDYSMNYAGLEKAFAEGAKMMLLCNPHNPVGRVWTWEECRQLADLCIRYNVFLIVDEIHRDLLMPGVQYTCFTDIPGMAERCIEVISPSKTFNLGGFHISTAIVSDPDLRRAMRDRLKDIGLTAERPTVMSMAAQTACYTHGETWVRELREYLNGNFDLAVEILKGTPLKAAKPDSTYLLWVDCSALNMNTDTLKKFMIERAHIYPELGSVFDSLDFASYKGHQTHMRLGIGMPRCLVEEAMTALKEAINTL